ncbi:hypothetical protein BaRGS_00033827 [Batillaria attramentaria]|uniref:Uncharacterized protein n=1 Tax=Batillaria attramentaria TaxID=370345 RepID=A0ABD0JJV8_9CAEN
MQSLTHTTFTTSEQHKESTNARLTKDHKDTVKVIQFLFDKKPFQTDDELRSIVTGQAAQSSVNVENAKKIGQKILEEMTDKPVADLTFQKSSQAVTMGTSSALKIGEEVVHVDPQLLFQRLLTVAQDNTRKLEEIFRHELTSISTSLFDQNGLLREANKHTLAQYLWSEDRVPDPPPARVRHIIDGGSLLHRLPWPRGSSYRELADMYVHLVSTKYPDATVVFSFSFQ